MTTIDGQLIAYDVLAGTRRMWDGEGHPVADMFSVAYLRSDTERSPTGRPIIFFFPGGPGSAVSGLVIGGFGPRVVDYPVDSSRRAQPVLTDNSRSLVDLADLVFVDMPGVGFSRLLQDGRAAQLNGIVADAKLHAAFVLQWLADHDRVSDPVLLAGKSYGVIRVSHIALHLANSSPNIRLAGLILLSGAWDIGAMDFEGSFTVDGDLSANWSYLPTFAAVAWHYGKVAQQVRFEDFINHARQFALNEYAPALLHGEKLNPHAADALARKMSNLIGLPKGLIRAHGNRINLTIFRDQLIPGHSLGLDNATFMDDLDPHEFGGDRALDKAWENYLSELGFSDASAYVIGSVTPAVHWDWLVKDEWRMGYPKATEALKPLFKVKPGLRLFIAVGYFDLATPFFMTELSAAKTGMPKDRIRLKHYFSGHTLWIHPPTRSKLHDDLRAFLDDSLIAPP